MQRNFQKKNLPRLILRLRNKDLNFSTLVLSCWSADTSQELSSEDDRAVEGGIRGYFFCADPRPTPRTEFGKF